MKLPDSLDDICARAVSVKGHKSQEMAFIGELGELLTLFGRRNSGRDTPEQWIDEITDGVIMIHQLAHMHGMRAVEKRLAEKCLILGDRVTKWEAGATISEKLA